MVLLAREKEEMDRRHVAISPGNLADFARELAAAEVTPQQFHDLVRSGILSDVLQPHINLRNREDVRLAVDLERPLYTVTLGTREWTSVDELCEAAKCPSYFFSDVKPIWEAAMSTFTKVPMEVDIKLFRANRDLSTKQMLKELRQRNLARPTQEHAIMFDLQQMATPKRDMGAINWPHEPLMMPDGRGRFMRSNSGLGHRAVMYMWRELNVDYRYWERTEFIAGVADVRPIADAAHKQ